MDTGSRTLFGAIFLALAAVSTAVAGPFEDGFSAAGHGDYATALQLWRPLADQGNADAQFGLGVMYSTGQGVVQNFAEAVRWWRKAADQGNVGAQYNLGYSYDRGFGVPQDYHDAILWYERAALRPYVAPVSAATNGSNLATMEAQIALGLLYKSGHGVALNFLSAVQFFRTPADQGYAPAQYELGVMYFNGQGVPQDYVLAHMWFNLAAAQSDAEKKNLRDGAVKYRDRLAAMMTPAQVAEAQRLARVWKSNPIKCIEKVGQWLC